MTAIREFELPNGRTIRGLNADDVLFTRAELWEQGGYLRHGVTLEPGAVIVDAGANLGIFALWALDRCDGDATIHCFEPVPAVADLLRENVRHAAPSIQVHPFGLSDREENDTLRFHPGLTLWTTRDARMDEVRSAALAAAMPEVVDLVLRRASEKGGWAARLLRLVPRRLLTALGRRKLRDFGAHQTVQARFRPLGVWLRENGISRIDLLKIDTEGDEMRVLAGIDADQWPAIRQVAVEVDGEGDAPAGPARELLEGLGFEVSLEWQGVDGVPWAELGAKQHRPCSLFARRTERTAIEGD